MFRTPPLWNLRVGTASIAAVLVQQILGKNIRAIREAKGMSQEALADLANLHPVQIGRVERGKHDVKASTVVKIAHGLGVPAAELWAGL